MNFRVLFISISIVLLIALLVLRRGAQTPLEEPANALAELPEVSSAAKSPYPGGSRGLNGTGNFNSVAATRLDMADRFRTQPEQSAALLAEWQAPIDFYGRVVDEADQAVAGAKVGFLWVETPTESGSKTAATESDTNGCFSLHGVRGASLQVLVTKPGYYTSQPTPKFFRYAFGDLFTPDAKNPVVFHLKQKGHGSALVTSDSGLGPDLPVRAPTNGTPIRVDLLKRKVGQFGELQIAQTKPGRGKWPEAKTWAVSLEITDGGFIENADEFAFLAPESGYQATVSYQFARTDSNWVTNFRKSFYIAFGQPRKYGSLSIESDISQETIFLRYAVNPSGSRNLEPGEAGAAGSKTPPE